MSLPLCVIPGLVPMGANLNIFSLSITGLEPVNQFSSGTNAISCVALLQTAWIVRFLDGSLGDRFKAGHGERGGFSVKLASMGLVPGSHRSAFSSLAHVAPWVAGTSPAMTIQDEHR